MVHIQPRGSRRETTGTYKEASSNSRLKPSKNFLDAIPWLYEALPKTLLYGSTQFVIGIATTRWLLGNTAVGPDVCCDRAQILQNGSVRSEPRSCGIGRAALCSYSSHNGRCR